MPINSGDLGADMKLEFVHADTCSSDYWSGHHLPHVCIPVRPRMTLREIKSAIYSELRMRAVMGSNDDTRLLSSDFIDLKDEKRADMLTRAAYAAVNRIRGAKKGQRVFFTDLEASADEADGVYAWFVLVEI